jgi:NAD(P)-dependent dehydrogenase (short-subunit alcohol dehydrogenase family)
VADLSGKSVLVTGANSGIGLEACVQLARMGADLTMVARDRSKGEAAVRAVEARARRSRGDAPRVRTPALLLCDMASQSEIRALADEYRRTHARLDILINNAGSVSPSRELTADGIEKTFAVNHLGYFLLTTLLLDLIVKSAPSRIVNTSSIGHYRGTIDFDDLDFDKEPYNIMKAYGRSKLANVLFTRELAKRLAGSGVTVNALHPGAVATNIWSHAMWWARPLLAVAKLFMVTPEQGGERLVYLAASPEVEGKTGGYYDNNRLTTPSPLAQDDAVATRLWHVSERLTSLDTSSSRLPI